MFVYPLGEYVHRITFCTTLYILEKDYLNFKQKQMNLAISEQPRGEDQFTIGYKYRERNAGGCVPCDQQNPPPP